MIADTEEGFNARQYFIAMEEKAKQLMIDQLEWNKIRQVQDERYKEMWRIRNSRSNAVIRRLLENKTNQDIEESNEYMSLHNYRKKYMLRDMNLQELQQEAKNVKIFCADNDILIDIETTNYGRRNIYPTYAIDAYYKEQEDERRDRTIPVVA